MPRNDAANATKTAKDADKAQAQELWDTYQELSPDEKKKFLAMMQETIEATEAVADKTQKASKNEHHTQEGEISKASGKTDAKAERQAQHDKQINPSSDALDQMHKAEDAQMGDVADLAEQVGTLSSKERKQLAKQIKKANKRVLKEQRKRERRNANLVDRIYGSARAMQRKGMVATAKTGVLLSKHLHTNAGTIRPGSVFGLIAGEAAVQYNNRYGSSLDSSRNEIKQKFDSYESKARSELRELEAGPTL